MKFNLIRKWQIFNEDLYDCPSDIAINDDGDIYVSLSENSHIIQVFNKFGDLLKIIGNGQIKRKKLHFPMGIDVDKNGNLYSVDSGNNRIVVFNNKDEVINVWGKSGNQDGNFNLPSKIKISNTGKIYISDILNNRIQVFDLKGNHIFSLGEKGSLPGEMFSPKHIALCDDGSIYIYELGNRRIQKINNQKMSISIIKLNQLSTNFCGVDCMCMLGDYLIVVDSHANAIHVISDDKLVSTVTDLCHEDEHKLWEPNSVIYNNGTLFVADTGNHAIKVFSVEF